MRPWKDRIKGHGEIGYEIMERSDMKREGETAEWPYEDIVNLPHHVSKKHPQMPMAKRAAQFAPFAALKKGGLPRQENIEYGGTE